MEHWSTYDYDGAYLHSAACLIVENDHVNLADSNGWHTFSVLWEPNKIVWYLDGQEVLSTTQDAPQQAMYFIANVANSTDGPGCNGTMQISSVKVGTALRAQAQNAGPGSGTRIKKPGLRSPGTPGADRPGPRHTPRPGPGARVQPPGQ